MRAGSFGSALQWSSCSPAPSEAWRALSFVCPTATGRSDGTPWPVCDTSSVTLEGCARKKRSRATVRPDAAPRVVITSESPVKARPPLSTRNPETRGRAASAGASRPSVAARPKPVSASRRLRVPVQVIAGASAYRSPVRDPLHLVAAGGVIRASCEMVRPDSGLRSSKENALSKAHSDSARRVTILDIAKRAGVSKGAVSYALNGRPGVSDETRERVLAIAAELGWYPNRAARSLSAARADACGLVLARSAKALALEPFFMEFIAGVEAELSARSSALMIQVVPDVQEEIAVYRRWWGERRVDGVLMLDLRIEDPRVDELVRLGLPAVVVGGPLPDRALPAVWHDEGSAVAEVVRFLAKLGHDRIARVAGVSDFVHTAQRTEAFEAVVRELGLAGEVLATDYTPESGARATRALLAARKPPTAIVYDSDLLAVTGLGVAQQLGFAVPGDVSIVGWDDSLISQVVHPPLTAVTRDIAAYGSAATAQLLAAIEGDALEDVEAAPGRLTTRGSTGPARDRRT